MTKITSRSQSTKIIKDSTQLESVFNTVYFLTVTDLIPGPRVCTQLLVLDLYKCGLQNMTLLLPLCFTESVCLKLNVGFFCALLTKKNNFCQLN